MSNYDFRNCVVEAKKLSFNGYEAILSLDEHGKSKSWLLTGWGKGKPDAVGKVSTKSNATQNRSTFSRSDLGAGLKDILLKFRDNINKNVSKLVDENGAPKEIFLFNDEKGYDPVTMVLKETKIPIEFAAEIAKWAEVSKSPYSDSFYNTKNKTWGHTPEGSFRISNHWNFQTSHSDKVHCKTDKPTPPNTVTLAQYHNGIYYAIKSIPPRNGEMIKDGEQYKYRDEMCNQMLELFDLWREGKVFTSGKLGASYFLNSKTGQIKSATDNAGTWDSDVSIKKSVRILIPRRIKIKRGLLRSIGL